MQEQAASSAISFHEDGSPSEAVRYNGKNYDYDDDVISILVFGVDNSTYEKKNRNRKAWICMVLMRLI